MALDSTMQGDPPAMRVSDSDGKLDLTPSPHNHRVVPRGLSSKVWQYSDHMENICGYLMKYTNLVTGWQFRFFVLNNEAGLLEYFVNEQSKTQKPRGTVQLAGAVISPSDEDSHTFTVNAASGELYKLRASDTKERQHWVSRLQICTQHHTEAIGKMMSQAECQQRELMRGIEGLSPSGQFSSLDQDLLMLKATSMATMNCLNDCFHMLYQQHTALQKSSFHAGAPLNWLEPKSLLSAHLENGEGPRFTAEDSKGPDLLIEMQEPESSPLSRDPVDIDPEEEEEEEDARELTEEDLGAVEEQRSVILHLLSQLKLGMDLTRVVLPTFILEKRSLLEMYADFLSHPDLFLSISGGLTPEARMLRFVEYYLTSFHEGRKGALAKKPYNPIIGETFHCSWRVPKDCVQTPQSSDTVEDSLDQTPPQEDSADGKDYYTVRFVAEQVSHHPPVSGFYAECPERKMCVNAHVWTKSKFMGMSIGVTMVGEGVLHLLDYDEEYTFTLPCAYARSILTVPWVELGGKVNVNCCKTGYSAAITFHTKPFYGGKLHRVTGEVKHNPTNSVVCKIQGEWNSVLEFTSSSGDPRCVDLTKLPVTRKRVRPVEMQGPFESRRLWSHVTEALMAKDLEKATEHKRVLEERQRAEERHRAETETAWKTKYFNKEGDGWIYNHPLWKSWSSSL
ncbi:oxysterol-binding protein-related protein 11 isoform X2 [Bufo bufo]|uniref:oxysterol-binding protein-related protein 11 isoform X2 n=1 Tax=Bufo bufo TaxID=8384 RepID=UPI001ABDD98D|nr:oxysterol-binding protein-related protein 11 isoform X2 [Bufo bufo]